MSARSRWAIAAAAAAALTVGASEAPLLLRHVDAFRVRRLHVTGTERVSAADAIEASGITSRASVFDDFEPWREALERHPLVLRARISRRLPDTIIFSVVETEPLALVRIRGHGLRPVDARGRVLPIAETQLAGELPLVNAVIAREDVAPRLEDDGVRAVRAFARIREAEPWLAAWTLEIEAVADGIRLGVRWPSGAEVLLSAPDADVLEAIRLTVLDLSSGAEVETDDAEAGVGTAAAVGVARGEAPGPALAATQLERLDRVDARFRDQVVVTLRENGRAGREEDAR